MQFVFNRGGNADSNGFADGHESELRRALIVRPSGTVPSAAVPVSAWEFRYAGARRRYLTRQLDPLTLEPMADGDVWSDYVGDSIYGDYTVDNGTATMTKRYVPGLWQTDLTPLGNDPPGQPTTAFFHTNMLGSTRILSDDAGAGSFTTYRFYSAFGVPVVEPSSPITRYGYAGAWGYQSFSALGTEHSGLLHVGARYYDPSIGRFLQRDPIGIAGGLNVYAYVRNNPTALVDPDGLNWRHQKRLPDGRFGPKKWYHKKVTPNSWLWAYGFGCGVARAGYWVTGQDYPGDPHWVIGETFYYYGSAWWQNLETERRVREHERRFNPPAPYEPRLPPDHKVPDIPCGPHW